MPDLFALVRDGVRVREGVGFGTPAQRAPPRSQTLADSGFAHPADKAARFLVAKGEVGECDACLEMATILKLGCPDPLASLRLSADRIAAMLTGLVRLERRRVEQRA